MRADLEALPIPEPRKTSVQSENAGASTHASRAHTTSRWDGGGALEVKAGCRHVVFLFSQRRRDRPKGGGGAT